MKRMPHKIFPLTFLTMRMPVKITPMIARTTVMPVVWKVPERIADLKEKRETLVAGLATIIWALVRPMKAINNPIPAETERFRFIGMALKMASRTLVRERRIKIRPSIQTAVSAISQE